MMSVFSFFKLNIGKFQTENGFYPLQSTLLRGT